MSVPDQMRVSVLHPDRSVSTQQRPVPVPGNGDVLVRVGAVGVCGSDVHYWREGRIGPGTFVDRDLVLGHEAGGRIEAVGAGVDPARVGQRVGIEPQRACHVCAQCRAGRYNLCPQIEFFATPPIDGAFAEFVTIPAQMAFPLPDAVSDEAAALLEPLSVAVAAVRKAQVVPGHRVFIAGAGPIGVIAAQTARAFGAVEVIVSDPAPARRELALRFGATSVIDPVATDVATAGISADAFIDAAGVPVAVVSGLYALGPAGRAVLVGMGADEIALPIPLIQNLELVVTGVFRYTDTWPVAIHLVASGQVALDPLVTSRFGLHEAEGALARAGDPQELKVVVYPGR